MKYITAFNELKRRYKSNYKLGVPLYLVNQYTVTSTSDLIIQYCTNTLSNEYYFLGLMYTEGQIYDHNLFRNFKRAYTELSKRCQKKVVLVFPINSNKAITVMELCIANQIPGIGVLAGGFNYISPAKVIPTIKQFLNVPECGVISKYARTTGQKAYEENRDTFCRAKSGRKLDIVRDIAEACDSIFVPQINPLGQIYSMVLDYSKRKDIYTLNINVVGNQLLLKNKVAKNILMRKD